MSRGQTGAVTEASMQPEEARRGVDKAWGRSTMGWDGVWAASNARKWESANAKQPKKKKKTYTSCAGAQADAGGACGNTAEGVGGRPVSDNLEKSISKGKKKTMQREKETYCTWQVT